MRNEDKINGRGFPKGTGGNEKNYERVRKFLIIRRRENI